jgi:pilus assembly protein FimV
VELPAGNEAALDFDLGGGEARFAAEAEMPAMDIIDFDLDGAPPESSAPAPQAAADEERDFTETLVSYGGPEGVNAVPATDLGGDRADSAEGASASDLGEFTVDFEVGDLRAPGAPDQAAADELAVPTFDLSSINLDLGAGPGEPATAAGASPSSGEDVSTKLALAKAYDEMGDQDQARELLREVIAEGGGEFADEARTILARLGG